MSQSLPLLDGYLPTIQKYLLSDDRSAFLGSLPQSREKTLLTLATNPDIDLQQLDTQLQSLDVRFQDRTRLQHLLVLRKLLFSEKPKNPASLLKFISEKILELNFDKYTGAHEVPTQKKAASHQTKIEVSNILKQPLEQVDTYLKQNNKSRSHAYKNLTNFGLSQVTDFSLLDKQGLEEYLQKMDLAHLGKRVYDLFGLYCSLQKNNVDNLKQYYWKLTFAQLEGLTSINKNVSYQEQYWKALLSKSFGVRLKEFQIPNSELPPERLTQKRAALLEMKQQIEPVTLKSFNSMRYELIREILNIGLLTKKIDMALFQEFLKYPKQQQRFSQIHPFIQNNNPKPKKKAKGNYDQYELQSRDWHYIHNINTSSWQSQFQFTKSYLEMYCETIRTQEPLQALAIYLDKSFLSTIFYKTRLHQGDHIADVQNKFSVAEFENIKNSKQLTILESNRKNFKVDEEIFLHLSIKNIKSVTIQVYELNTEKHYIDSFTEINSAVPLDFIHPTKSTTLKVPQAANPFRRNQTMVSLKDLLDDRRAVYVVDFKGEGLASRAVIRKGSIMNIQKQTLAGHEISFFYEDGTAIENLHIWIQGKKIPVKHRHIIPYGSITKVLNIVAVADGYAEMLAATVLAETYNLCVGFLYHEENFMIGSQAKILLQARLALNEYPVSLKALNNTRITVDSLNHQDVSSSFDVEDVKWDYKNEFELNIPITAYLKQMSITVYAEADTYSGKPQKLSAVKEIEFRKGQNEKDIGNFFLSQTSNQGYILKALGKNGEPLVQISVKLELRSEIFRAPFKQTLITDTKGEIILGRLATFTSIQVHAHKFRPEKWTINKERATDYPQFIALRAGEALDLPVSADIVLKRDVSLMLTSEAAGPIRDESALMSFQQHRIRATLKNEGLYILKIRYPLGYEEVKIQVMKGQNWKSSQNYIVKPESNELVELKSELHRFVGIHKPLITPSADGYNVKLVLNTPAGMEDMQSVRVHVFAGTFLHENSLADELIQGRTDRQGIDRRSLPRRGNEYFNNKELSDEECYILSRQEEGKRIGNNLEKPRIFLKRTENRDTTFGKQQLNKAGIFVPTSTLKMDKKKKQQQHALFAQKCFRKSSPATMLVEIGVPTVHNFLKHGAYIVANLHGRVLTFSIPKHYQDITVVVTSPSLILQRRFSLPKLQKLVLTDLRHKGLFDAQPNTGLTMSRECYNLKSGQSLTIRKDSQWAAVAGSNIVAYSRIRGAILPQWLSQWSSYSQEKKIKVYDEECCHELNCYIKIHDPKFFESVVRLFILNKLVKTPVDYCLLESEEEVLKLCEPQALSNLNAFQKCLLVHTLMKMSYGSVAQTISRSMQLEEKQNRPSDQSYCNQFDTVMLSKQIEIQASERMGGGVLDVGKGGANAQKPVGSDWRNQEEDDQSDLEMQQMEQEDERGDGFSSARGVKHEKNQSSTLKRISKKRAEDYQQKADEMLAIRKTFKPNYIPVEKTKQYVETTYSDVKDYTKAKLIPLSVFWSELAQHLLTQPNGIFLTHNFMVLNSKLEFALALVFLPPVSVPLYQLSSGEGVVTVTAKAPLTLFIKQVRGAEYTKKHGLLVNQRFIDPEQPFTTEEDGTRVSRQVDEFIKGKVYQCETIVTNTTVADLELQVLLDIPEGSIPIGSHEFTKIQTDIIRSYCIKSYYRSFYFPVAGNFRLYPANACRNKQIIAKSEAFPVLTIKQHRSGIKTDTLYNILQSGNKAAVLDFIRQKNIFDSDTFKVQKILYLLKDKQFYNQVSNALAQRKYYCSLVKEFAFFHQDLAQIKECIRERYFNSDIALLPLFQYFPLSSNRAHKFMRDELSTILNNQFRSTYNKFLISQLLGITSHDETTVRLAFVYYLILQDRIKEASVLLSKVDPKRMTGKYFPQLQYDYIVCFLDLYTGYPNFIEARRVSQYYLDYPVSSWQKLFKSIHDLLTQHDETIFVEQAMQEHEIRIINKSSSLHLLLPADTCVEVNFHALNLQFFFSQSPFMNLNVLSTVKPFKTQIVYSEKGGDQIVAMPKEFPNIYVQPVHVSSTRPPQPLSGFLWTNDRVKVKVQEDKGEVYVYSDGNPEPGAYVKVYSKNRYGESKFFKDGYTDIRGRFVYITSELGEVEQFALLMLSEFGGVVRYAKKPRTLGSVML